VSILTDPLGGATANGSPGDAAACAEMAIFVSDILSGTWLERDWDCDAVQAVIRRAAEARGVPEDTLRLQVALRILRDPELLEYPPASAIAAQLRRLLVLAPLDHVSLWVRGEGNSAICLDSVGADLEAAAEVAAARTILPDEARKPATGASALISTPVLRWQRPHAALVARPADTGARHQCPLLLGEATGILAAVVEREVLLRRNASKARALTEASERGLERLGLDLHDRPVQEVACLAEDLRLFKSQLRTVMADRPHAEVMIGRTTDLQGRLELIHSQLREISHGLVAPMGLQRPLPALLEAEATAFRTLTDIDLQMELGGELESLSASQRIAMLRIVHEALSNVREHAAATYVCVRVRGLATHIEGEIENDGRGFDVARSMADAARRGRLGLVGMTERARLLGGRCDIVSAPGSKTYVRVNLPRWDGATAAGLPAAARPGRLQPGASRR
jgi:signal transduction histidine kinase